ncbi:MAG: hypothetical protein AAB229_07355 [Candidatus Hydrogenedentota bacterium]
MQGRIPAYAIRGDGRTAWLFDVAEITDALRANSRAVIQEQRDVIERTKLTPEKITKIIQNIRSKTARG